MILLQSAQHTNMPVNGKIKPSVPLPYRDAGVDIDVGDALVDDIKKIVRSTRRPEVLAGVGGFGALVGLPKKYKQPILVSGTDGVGTKLRLGIDSGRVTGLGQDLVAMCVNDVLVSGAEPLFFLDYYATGKLDNKVAAQVIKGIAQGCKLAGAALVGGETAEMPGMYREGDFDLAGFCVAVVEKSKIIDGSKIRPGDVMIALPSSGPHSNGYSLVRKILERSGQPLDTPFGKGTLGDALLAPTNIYVKPILKLLDLGLRLHLGHGLVQLGRAAHAQAALGIPADLVADPLAAVVALLEVGLHLLDGLGQRLVTGRAAHGVAHELGVPAELRRLFTDLAADHVAAEAQ